MGIIHYVFEGHYDKNPQLFLSSKNFSCNTLDKEAVIQLKAWLMKEAVIPSKVRCFENGKVVDIQL